VDLLSNEKAELESICYVLFQLSEENELGEYDCRFVNSALA